MAWNEIILKITGRSNVRGAVNQANRELAQGFKPYELLGPVGMHASMGQKWGRAIMGGFRASIALMAAKLGWEIGKQINEGLASNEGPIVHFWRKFSDWGIDAVLGISKKIEGLTGNIKIVDSMIDRMEQRKLKAATEFAETNEEQRGKADMARLLRGQAVESQRAAAEAVGATDPVEKAVLAGLDRMRALQHRRELLEQTIGTAGTIQGRIRDELLPAAYARYEEKQALLSAAIANRGTANKYGLGGEGTKWAQEEAAARAANDAAWDQVEALNAKVEKQRQAADLARQELADQNKLRAVILDLNSQEVSAAMEKAAIDRAADHDRMLAQEKRTMDEVRERNRAAQEWEEQIDKTREITLAGLLRSAVAELSGNVAEGRRRYFEPGYAQTQRAAEGQERRRSDFLSRQEEEYQRTVGQRLSGVTNADERQRIIDQTSKGTASRAHQIWAQQQRLAAGKEALGDLDKKAKQAEIQSLGVLKLIYEKIEMPPE